MMAEIQHINRNSDFSILVQFVVNGVIAEVPSYPWRLVFTTDTTHSFNRYTASFDGEEFYHCHRVSDSEVMVVFDSHNLGPGLLRMNLEVDIPNNVYQDGTLSAEIPASTQIELWDQASDPTPPSARIEAIIAYMIHGKGVPHGGAAGQVLKKNSNKDYDTTWGEDEGITEIAPGAVKWDNLSEEVIDEIDSKPGRIVESTGIYSQAEVFNTAQDKDSNGNKPGMHSHAENVGTFAGGEAAHAEGIGTQAMAYGSHTEGNNTEAKPSAKFGHAGGKSSIVEAEAGFAHGVNAVSKNRGEAVFGKNNEPDTTGKSLFQVGIGENKSHPKTGFQIDSDGSVWIINLASGNRVCLQSWLRQTLQINKDVVDVLPETGEPNTIYLLRVVADEGRHNYFAEYIYQNGQWELLGTSDTDESIIMRILKNPLFIIGPDNIADKALQMRHFSDNCIIGNYLYDNTITARKIYPKSITGDRIADRTIGKEHLTEELVNWLGSQTQSLPQSELCKTAGCTCIRPAAEFNVPESLGLPYIGVQAYSRGRWRLTREIKGMNISTSQLPEYSAFQQNLGAHIAGTGWQPLPRVDLNGEGDVDVIQLFKSEFVAIGNLVDGDCSGAPKHMQWQRLHLFTRDKRNIGIDKKQSGSRMMPSAHNPIRVYVNDFGAFIFDTVRKGNKQVIRRKYKVGYVWPINRTEDGEPLWDGGYYSSNWTDVMVERVVYLYKKDPIEMLSVKIE